MELPAVSTARSCKYIWYSCTEIIRRKITTRHKDKKLYLRTKINCWHKLSRFCIITLMAVLYWSSKQRALSGCWAAMVLPLPPTAAPEVPGLRAGTTTAPQEANKEIQNTWEGCKVSGELDMSVDLKIALERLCYGEVNSRCAVLLLLFLLALLWALLWGIHLF